MKIIGITIYLMTVINVYAEPKLPECIGNKSSIWNDCRGAIVKNLSAYVGDFKNGLPEGYGTFTYPDGAVYVGGFKEGKEHGMGTFTCWTHGSQYIGQFQKGKKHGDGIYTYPDGVIYDGQWSKGVREGDGVLTYTDGRELTGKFSNDKYLGN